MDEAEREAMTQTDLQTRPSRKRAALAFAALIAALAAIAVPSAGAAVPRSFYGVVPQTPVDATDFARMGQGRVGTVRVLLAWNSVDPTAAPNDYDWSAVDSIFANAASNNVEVLPFLFGTPTWVAQDLDGYGCGGECATFAPRSAAALAAWQQFVADVVARYGPNGAFWAANPSVPKQPIAAYQIWNEQNSREFFAPKQSPGGYAALLDSAVTAIRSGDPAADIVLGGMAQLAGSSKATKGSKYLNQLYKVNGVKSDFDGFAIHPYGSSVEKVVDQVELFRDIAKKSRDRNAEMWITELGWGSKSGGNPLNRGKRGQADRLKESFKYFKKKRNKLNIETVNWFSWRDSATKICDWCASSGLFTQTLAAKPAWRAFTKFTGGS
jgi:hypothetical protein